jgi:GT2 family glycosyltransferase
VKTTITDHSNIVFVNRGEAEVYSYSKFANRLVACCSEEFICLMNDDIEVIDSDWLSTMLNYAKNNEIGVVGAKLLYPNGTIQHVGCRLNPDTVCGHIHAGELDYDTAFWNQHTDYYSVVTGAVSVMRKSIYELIGGYDEDLVAYNDVDFCLKALTLGYKNIYVPVTLIHEESATRGSELEFLEADRQLMKDRWRELLANDPYEQESK